MRWRTLRWAKQSLRTKITIVNVVLLTFGLLVSGLGTLALLRPSLIDQLDKQLLAAQRDPSILTGGATDADPCESAGGVQATGRTFFIACLNNEGVIVTQNWHTNEQTNQPDVSSIRSELGELDRTGMPFTLEDDQGRQSWRAIVTSTGSASDASATRMIVALPLSSVNATITNFVIIFFSFGLAVVLLGAALTRLLVSSTLAPLREVEETASAIAAGDYSQRLAGATPNTEVGRLNRSLNIMLNRIDKAFSDRQRTIAQMRRFIGDASHELRTPLVTVRGYAELYRMGAITSEDDVEQAFQRIEGEAKRMSGLVEDLLQLARLDESNRKMEFAPVDLETIAYDAAMDTRAAAPGRTVTPLPLRTIDDPRTSPIDLPEQSDSESSSFFRSERKKRRERRSEAKAREAAKLDMPATGTGSTEAGPYDTDEIPAMAWANEDKIRQSVQNIIGNALRYTPEDSPIEIGAVVDEAHKKVMIEVIDHGEGIPEPIRNKIFERFWRADTSRTRDTGGSGLGLAIVSAIVKAHSGTVHIIETPGGGATFQIELPLLESLDGPEPSTGSAPSRP